MKTVDNIPLNSEGGQSELLCTSAEAMRMLGITKRQLYSLVYERKVLKKHPGFWLLMFKKKDVQEFANMT
jgi:hypothetical protein